MNNTFERNWDEALWLNLRYNTRTFQEGMNETTKSLSHDEGRQCPGRDSNRLPPEYKRYCLGQIKTRRVPHKTLQIFSNSGNWC
jgi:hypothetical protein